MRTKHIFTAMVLPALFAACTADDFEVVNNAATESQRPMLSGVTLNVVGDADTRYAVDDNGSSLKFTYENGDKIGAAIIDEYGVDPVTGEVKPADEWDIIKSQGGVCNPFTYNANTGEWTTINSIGVGHYIFVYPYNSTNIQRHAVTYELPIIQKLYQEGSSEVDLNAAIEKGNQAIYSALLEEDDLVVDAYMRNLFAYPTFRINIDNGVRVNKVTQVVLEYTNENGTNANTLDGFVVKGGLDHDKVFNIFDNEESSYWVGPSNKVTDWDKVQTNDLLLDDATNGGYLPDGKNLTSPYLIAKFPEGGVDFGRDANTNNKVIEVRFMIPGAAIGEYNNNTINHKHLAMHIYTDNGIYTIDDVYSAIVFNKTTENSLKSRVFARNTSYTLNLDKSAVHVGKDSYIVTTVEDWNNLVDEYGASGNYANGLPIKVIGDEFSFNNEVKFPTKAVFKVETDVKVTGDVTIKNVSVDNNTVTVEKDATLTTTGSFKAEKIVNKGTLNVAPKYNNRKEAVLYADVKSIINHATLNINEETIAEFALFNGEDGKVTNEGEITIKDATVDSDEGNFGIIDNEGQIESEGFTNNSREYNGNKVVNEPTINNNGTIRSIGGDLVNKSVINNNGRLTCQSLGGTITNDKDVKNVVAVLESVKGATTYITNNNGHVVVYEAVPNNSVVITNQKGDVVYTATAAKEDFKSGTNASIVTYVIAEGSLEFANMGKVTKLDINEAATLKLPATDYDLNYVNVKADLTLATNLTVNNKLTIAEDITVKVNAGTTLDVQSMYNEGLIDVAGKFVANMSGEEDNANELAGKVEESQDNASQVVWEQSTAATAKTAYQTALNAAVKAWAEDDRPLGLTVNNVSYNLKGQTNAKEAASALFAKYYEANKGKSGFDEQTTLETKYNAYVAVVPGAKLTEGYNAAVADLMKRESEKTFTDMVKTLTYSTADTKIYENASKALEGFKAAVAAGTVSVNEQLDKVVICTSDKNYAPACSQVVKGDAIYEIFGEDAIAYTDNWMTAAGFTEYYMAKGNSEAWTLALVKGWINEVASADDSKGNLFIKTAKQYVEDNNLITESKSWTYADAIIKAIVADQEYNK